MAEAPRTEIGRQGSGAGDQFVSQPLRRSRAYEELAAVIRERIDAGELKKGEQVPSEAELARAAQVSRSTVREALRTLEASGFIERASQKVMVVARDIDEPAHRELRRALGLRDLTYSHVHRVLMVLEPELTRLAARRADQSDLAALRGCLEVQRASLDDFQDWNRLDVEFHLMIAEMSANPALILARTPIVQITLQTMRGFVDSRAKTEKATRYHERMVEAIGERDADAAARITAEHVDDFRTAWLQAGIDLASPIDGTWTGS